MVEIWVYNETFDFQIILRYTADRDLIKSQWALDLSDWYLRGLTRWAGYNYELKSQRHGGLGR